MDADERKSLILELVDTLLKSWWTIVAGVCFGLTGALLVMGFVQEWYEATAKLYVTPEISRDLTRSTVTEDMTRRMMAMEEAVLSTDSMRSMIERTYGLTIEDDVKLAKWARRIRRDVTITPTAVGGAQDALFAFELTYREVEAERAALGANTLAELYIAQNEDFRQSQAREAARAAAEHADQTKREFEEAERALIDYRERHRFETADHLESNLRLHERREDALDNNLRDQRAAENQLQDLRDRLSEVEAGAASAAQQVAELRRELDALLVQYSEAHPEVIRVRRKLEEALGAANESGGGDPTDYPPDPQVTALRGEIEDVRRERAELKKRETRLRGEIAEFERRIDAVPRVQPELSRLENDRNMLRDRYETAQEKADRAGESLFLEQQLRGERFELAERAEVPRFPVYPQPLRFYALGVIAGCLFFVGPPLARRFLKPVISSEAGLRALTEIPVLVTIPRILTPETQGISARRTLKNVALSTLCAALTVTAFVFLA